MEFHELKTWPIPFLAVVEGRKTHEIRKADRRFAEGNFLILREWIPPEDPKAEGEYTGSFGLYRVTYLTAGGAWDIPAHLVVMSIRGVHIFSLPPTSELARRVRVLCDEGLADLSEEERGAIAHYIRAPKDPAASSDLLTLRPEPPELGMPGGRFRFN